MKKIYLNIILLLSSTLAFSQVKIGNNPTTIQNNTNFEVESTSGNRFVVSKDSSKVGIGTASPAAKLDVIGKVKITDGTEGAGKIFISNTNGVGSWQSAASALAGIEPWYSTTTNTGATSNTENIYSLGKVGIGTATPNDFLEVKSGTLGTGLRLSSSQTGNYGTIGIQSGSKSAGDRYMFYNNNFASTPASRAHAFAVGGTELVTILQNGNVGVGADSPTSTLSVNGSLARKYKAVTASTYQILADDYFIHYKGATSSVLTLPVGTSATCNCQGRAYEILNATSSEITINPSGSETIDTETTIKLLANQSIKIVNTGAASGATWSVVQFSPIKSSASNFEVYSTAFNGKVNTVETLATVMTPLQSADLVVTIPNGYANNRVVLRWDLWGAGYPLVSSQAAGGSLVFDIENVGNTIYSPVLYTSFASVASLLNARFTAPVAYYLTDLAPGTYTFKLRCALIDTVNVHSADIRGISAIATVYVK